MAILHETREAVLEPDHVHVVVSLSRFADGTDGGVETRRVPTGSQETVRWNGWTHFMRKLTR